MHGFGVVDLINFGFKLVGVVTIFREHVRDQSAAFSIISPGNA